MEILYFLFADSEQYICVMKLEIIQLGILEYMTGLACYSKTNSE